MADWKRALAEAKAHVEKSVKEGTAPSDAIREGYLIVIGGLADSDGHADLRISTELWAAATKAAAKGVDGE